MKDNSMNSFEDPQILSAEFLLSKFGKFYRKKLVPAIRNGIDHLSDDAWLALNMHFFCGMDDPYVLAESLNCSVPDAEQALECAVLELQLCVKQDARLDITRENLSLLLCAMKESGPTSFKSAKIDLTAGAVNNVKKMLRSWVDLTALREFINASYKENAAHVYYLESSIEQGEKELFPTANSEEIEEVLPDGLDFSLKCENGSVRDMVLIRLTKDRQVYLLYKGDGVYKRIKLDGVSKTAPAMFFDLRSVDPHRPAADSWLRLGYLDAQSNIVLVSRSRRMVFQGDLSQVSMQFLEH